MQSFSPKTQGFAYKSGVILEFWGVCVRLLMDLLAWHETPILLNKALKRFLKLNQRL
ncbi:hypothetical protein [Helicobacter pylori]|uniref:hypothetical protein n=1 Tax=Helicobacter pylori TaxID=210 RepID=UPI0015E705D0|nr:hypothetical protein [Helicobacter pylori]